MHVAIASHLEKKPQEGWALTDANHEPNDNVFVVDQGCVRRLFNVYLHADALRLQCLVHERIEVVSAMSDILPT